MHTLGSGVPNRPSSAGKEDLTFATFLPGEGKNLRHVDGGGVGVVFNQ